MLTNKPTDKLTNPSSVDVTDDRSDPITYQMTEAHSASEPLPLARWPNTFLKPPEDELEKIPEGHREEEEKPKSSSSSSYTSTETLIARENAARRAAFERQWNTYLTRSPSPDPPAKREEEVVEEEEKEEEEDEESRMTTDHSHNPMTYDSHVQGQIDYVDDVYEEVSRTYYDSHRPHTPEKTSSSSESSRSTVKEESPKLV